ncbi:TetR/AcrR family transcriptional regulator [Listeria fleischmannii]|uniref:TetR/AcrR family transcriptional regulator n=1 Tax=Listeria fleischmannii TaxID=1069827 RepID=UPI001626CFA1|nr:TetR/AcrR family transcriptional regulator [Listeria fleischmannii]MBC1418697.1 TetR/AcrR family transcriptional regulator [Listeria fleischmannii]
MNENDLRVQKTKKVLVETFLEILEHEEMKAVTVNSICKKALIHRTTFYKHFYDKYDLLSYILKEKFQNYFSIDIKERINHPFESIMDNLYSDMKSIFEKQKEDETFFKTMGDFFLELLRHDIEKHADMLKFPKKLPVDLLTYVYTANLAAVLYWSEKGGHHYDGKKMDRWFQEILPVKIEFQKES